MKVSLLGYPNTGKTSVFNILASQNRKIANFPGVTVDAFEGNVNIDSINYKIIDLPGINSISSFSDSKDEIVVSKYIQDNGDDIFLNIIDISHLERNLLLTLAALSKKMKVILVVNMIDMVKLTASELDSIKKDLENNLKIPVVMFSAKKKIGVLELKQEIKNYSYNEDSVVITNTSDNIKIIKNIIKQLPKLSSKTTRITTILDVIFLNKILAIPIFLAVVYGILLITMNIHIVFSGLIEALSGSVFVDLPHKYLEGHVPEIILIILADGIGGGIQTMLTFIPIMFILFFLLGILEQSGYMARQAFISDGIMHKLGLPGKSFISLVLGLGCTAACASGCRTLERESDRRLSLMISPSISCSAKLPVYVYLCFITFGNWALNIVFLLYFLGILFAVINGIFLSKSLFRTKSLPFIMDLPDYMIPNFRYIFNNAYIKLKSFIFGLGKKIVPIIAFITILSSISPKGEIISVDSDNSILAKVSSFITPILSPMGIEKDNWQATLSLITGFLAKEVVVATLNSVYFSAGDKKEGDKVILNNIKTALIDFKDQLINRNHLDMFDIGSSYSMLDHINNKREILSQKFTSFAGMFAFLLFILIYSPCVSAMGSIAREINRKWAWMVGIWSTFNAFMIAILFYQISLGIIPGVIFSTIFIVVYTIIFFCFRYYGNKSALAWNSNFIFSKKALD